MEMAGSTMAMGGREVASGRVDSEDSRRVEVAILIGQSEEAGVVNMAGLMSRWSQCINLPQMWPAWRWSWKMKLWIRRYPKLGRKKRIAAVVL